MPESTENLFNKPTFSKINPDRKQKVLDAAISNFAKYGFRYTNINNIATEAGISIGSMYSYFESKDDLYLTVINYGHEILQAALAEVDLDQVDIFQIFEDILNVAKKYAQNHQEMNQLYLDLTTQGMSHLADRLSHQLEDMTSFNYHTILRKAVERGQLDSSLDINTSAFCIDNLIVMCQFSFTSDYYKKRMNIFLNNQNPDKDDLIKEIMLFIRRSLTI
ncbi:MAG: TetR/AcrR family transcriptional regulator [Spirochaetaceae bacterium]